MKKMLLEIIIASLVLAMTAVSLAGCMQPNASGATIINNEENPAIEAEGTAGASKTDAEEAVVSEQNEANEGGMSGNDVEHRLEAAMKEFLIGLAIAFVFTVAAVALIDYTHSKYMKE